MHRPPLIDARQLSKEFANRRVLDRVDFEVRHGEIHGLVGQNGSGKSTLVKILAGYHDPEPGARLDVRGVPVRFPMRPGDSARLGVSIVHQDLGLLQGGTVLENFRIGRHRTGLGWRISWRDERTEVREALHRFGLRIQPDAAVSSLGQVDQAMLAIARSVDQLRSYRAGERSDGSPGGLLVMDEPTAYLPADGVKRLFAAMQSAAAMDSGVLFISHRLAEILAITDRVTVIRDGRKIGTFGTAEMTQDRLIDLILGFSLGSLYPESHPPVNDVVISVRGLRGAGIQSLSLDLRRGEILGLTGLVGMGYERIPYLMFGAQPASGGELTIDGRVHQIAGMTPRRSIDLGFAFIPGDRIRESGVPAATALENITLPSLGRLFSGGLLRRRRQLSEVLAAMEQFQVVPAEPDRPFSLFSGGNQQKALIAKWLLTSPRCLLMHEPTQGVDIGAKRQIFRVIRNLAEQGIPVVLASAEYGDLEHMCDRVMVFHRGAPVSELRGDWLTEERIVEQCFRGGTESHEA